MEDHRLDIGAVRVGAEAAAFQGGGVHLGFAQAAVRDGQRVDLVERFPRVGKEVVLLRMTLNEKYSGR